MPEQASGVDYSTPSPARIYDSLLGGTDNFPVDREVVKALVAKNPQVIGSARQNRGFLGRAVHHLAEQGVRQFLDIGSGLPTADNVHQVARRVRPDARVVYVDNDPVALRYGASLVANDPLTRFVYGDVRDPNAILNHEATRELIDLSEPVAVLLVAILHFISDEEDPASIVAKLRERVSPGSYLVLSHGCAEPAPGRPNVGHLYRSSANLSLRPRCVVETFFRGWELIEPGVEDAGRWRRKPLLGELPAAVNAGVARRVT